MLEYLDLLIHHTVIIFATIIEFIKEAIGSIPKIMPISVDVKSQSLASIGKKGATTFFNFYFSIIFINYNFFKKKKYHDSKILQNKYNSL